MTNLAFLQEQIVRRAPHMAVTAEEKARKAAHTFAAEVADLARAMNRLAPLAEATRCPDYESAGPLACDCEDCFRVAQYC